MRKPRILTNETIFGKEGEDIVICFHFDADLVADGRELEFDRNQFIDGEPPESAYVGLHQALARIIRREFEFPKMDPRRHIRVAGRELTLTLDPYPWSIDLDPASNFTYHYGRPVRRH